MLSTDARRVRYRLENAFVHTFHIMGTRVVLVSSVNTMLVGDEGSYHINPSSPLLTIGCGDIISIGIAITEEVSFMGVEGG